MNVSEVMTRRVITIPATLSCRAAVETMHRCRISHLPVVDADGTLRGIVTNGDLRHRLFTPGVLGAVGTTPVERLLAAVPVSDVMSCHVATIDPDDPVESAAGRMVDEKIGSLVVVRDGRVAGIVTETDLLRRIVGEDASCAGVVDVVISFP